MNRVILIGRLGREPELRYTQSGTAVANFSLATSEKFQNKKGEREERTEWHQIVAWGRTGEVCSEYLDKGSLVAIEGTLRTREWEDKEGAKRKTTEIVAQRVDFLGGGGDKKKESGGGKKQSRKKSEPDEYEEDIPF